MLRTAPILLLAAATLPAQVYMTPLGTVDIAITSGGANPEYIGNNASAMVWNGNDLWLAGFNNQAAAGNVAIIKVSNALATTPTFGTPFGLQSATPAQRGYTGLDLDGTRIVAAYDPGASSPQGITAYDLAGTQLWAKATRGSCGVALDPGFYTAVDAGTAWTSFGAGFRALQDNVTGADIYTLATGMPLSPVGTSNIYWRDMDFEPSRGDIWLRRANKLIAGERAAGNVLINERVVVDATQADLINLHHLAYVRHPMGDLVFWNDRPAGTSGQQFSYSVRCTRPSDGTDVVLDWGPFLATVAAGSGAYDFSYDEATRTLAILDFSNRKVYVFAVSMFRSYGTGCQGVGGITPLLTASGDSRAGGTINYSAAAIAPSSIGAFFFGTAEDNTPLPFPGGCPQHVTPILGSAGLFFTFPGLPGSGAGTLALPIPAGPQFLGYSLTTQVLVLDPSTNALVTSNGIYAVL
jgi:hypothetical protein